MADSNLRSVQSSFSGGELDPLMRFRVDLKTYLQSMKRGRNIMLYAQGGFRRRPGMGFKYDLTEYSVLHDFSFSQGQDYLFAFQNTAIRFLDGSGTHLQTSTGMAWGTANIDELTTASSADTTIVCHSDFWPQRILRTGASTFTIADFAFEEHADGFPRYQPYYKFEADAVTVTPSVTTGSGTLTASSAVFTADLVGTIMRYKGKEMLIDSFTSTTVLQMTVRETLPSITADVDWDEQAFSALRGYPRAVVFHDQRLYFAGTSSRPDGFWGSKVGGFFNFDLGTALADEGIDANIGGDQVGEVRHLVSSRNIQIYMANGEMYVPQSVANPITPTNIQFIEQTPYGSSVSVAPTKFDGATLFMQRTGKVIREYLWNDTEQSYTSGAVSIASNHLINSAVDSCVLLGTSDQPEQFAFFVNSDGTVAVFSSIRNENMAGWVQWNTDGLIKSMASTGDRVFAYVERTIDSVTEHFLEEFDWDATLDCSLTQTAAATVTWTAAHLPNTLVKVTTNSSAQYAGEFTSNGSGVITTNDLLDDTEIGLNYDIDVETLPVDAVSRVTGSVTGDKKRISRVVISVLSTQSVSITNNRLIMRQVNDDLSLPPDAAEGEYEFYLLGWTIDPTIVITQTEPLPLTVRGIYAEVTA